MWFLTNATTSEKSRLIAPLKSPDLNATPFHLLYPPYSTSIKCTDCVILSWFYVLIIDATFFLKYPYPLLSECLLIPIDYPDQISSIFKDFLTPTPSHMTPFSVLCFNSILCLVKLKLVNVPVFSPVCSCKVGILSCLSAPGTKIKVWKPLDVPPRFTVYLIT